MHDFPSWAVPKLANDEIQVSHGLNLALPLKDPLELPLLLWDIVVVRPKLKRALEQLSFVHFARLVPSWDGTALMVTTEFDGPLEPYVMDFVIALGDVFNVLLRYTKNAPPLPVQEYPDEFWQFVQKWNRVPIVENIRFPPDFDYPLYSAYPDKTVTDITGPRTVLPQPAVDHPAAWVDLSDVQGNILSGYAANAAVHSFCTIVDAAAARKWLATQFPDGARWNRVMSAVRWRSHDGKIAKPQLMANVGFTFPGLKALLPKRRDVDLFPAEFQEGADKRSGDNGDVDASAPANWLFGRDAQAIHVVLSLYTHDQVAQPLDLKDKSTFARALTALRGAAEANGLKFVYQHEAYTRPDGTVDFGYMDGISKPRISGQCKPDDPDFQPAASPGEFLLGKDYKSIYGGTSLGRLPADLAQNGTFGVLRLMEQHVGDFDQAIAQGAQDLKISPDLLKAKLLGRWPDGSPLSLDDKAATGGARNDFDFAPSWEHPGVTQDHEGLRCPVGAHIRRTNPRTARVAGERHSRRLIRRGMPSKWKDAAGDKVGLLGLFMGASIERQFEFIQRQWVQGDLGASGIRGTQDPIASVRSTPTVFHVPGVGDVTIPPLITTRGCLYLFFPSLSMLRGLEQLARAPDCGTRRHRGPGILSGPPGKQIELALAGLMSVRAPRAELKFAEQLLIDDRTSPTLKALYDTFSPAAQARCVPVNPSPPGNIRPLDPAFIADPFTAYKELRDAKRPVVWVPEHHAHWVLSSDLVDWMLSNPGLFRQEPSTNKLRGILTMDDPRHAHVRPIVQKAFDEAMKNIDGEVDQAIDDALAGLGKLEQFDFVAAFGARVPKTVFWRIFGLRGQHELDEIDALAQTARLYFNQPDRRGMGDAFVFADASIRMAIWMGVLLGKAILVLGQGRFAGTLIGGIARRTGFGADRLSLIEAVMTLTELALVHMSSQFLLGSATRNLLMPDPQGGPAPWAVLAKASGTPQFDDMLKRALNEARRVDPPVTIVQRYAANTIQVGNVTVQADCPVYAVVASANRDLPGVADQEHFHWDRDPGLQNYSLGLGMHHCIGAMLQCRIVRPTLTRLIGAMPALRLCDETAVPAWIDNIYFRCLQSLPVTRCPVLKAAGAAA
jgi:cytochrome P450/deferrochelatase/peroxidase EfeB